MSLLTNIGIFTATTLTATTAGLIFEGAVPSLYKKVNVPGMITTGIFLGGSSILYNLYRWHNVRSHFWEATPDDHKLLQIKYMNRVKASGSITAGLIVTPIILVGGFMFVFMKGLNGC